jgi:hypothetical protein
VRRWAGVWQINHHTPLTIRAKAWPIRIPPGHNKKHNSSGRDQLPRQQKGGGDIQKKGVSDKKKSNKEKKKKKRWNWPPLFFPFFFFS